MAWMLSAQPLRHQLLDLLAQNFLPAIAEKFLNLSVHQDNFSALIDHHDSIGRRFEQPPELRIRTPLLGDVDSRGDDIGRRLFGAWQYRRRPCEDSLFTLPGDPSAFVFGARGVVANLVE